MVLPESLIRSFILLIEKELKFKENQTNGFRSTVQILLSDSGPSGVSSLVRGYAEASKRNLYLFVPSRDDFDEEMIPKILQLIQQDPSPVIFFDHFSRGSKEFHDLVRALLLKDKSLLRNASFVIGLAGDEHFEHFKRTFPPLKKPDDFYAQLNRILALLKKPNEPNEPNEYKFGYLEMLFSIENGRSQSLDTMIDIARLADSIHLVRNPQSSDYYLKITDQLVRGHLSGKDLQESILQVHTAELATSAFDLQSATGSSVIRQLGDVIMAPPGYLDDSDLESFSCRYLVSSRNNSAIKAWLRFKSAALGYNWGLHNSQLK